MPQENVLKKDDGEATDKAHRGNNLKNRKVLHRIPKSLAIFATYLALGLGTVVVGPTVVTMEKLLHTDTSTISGVFMAMGVGYMCGAILCGLTFDHANKEMQFAFAISVQILGRTVAPFTSSVYIYIFCIGLSDVGMGFSESAGVSYMFVLWVDNKFLGPLVQGLNVCWSLGAFIAPFLVRPFLVNFNSDIISNSTNHTTLNDSNIVPLSQDNLGLVRYAYVTIGCLALPAGITFLILFILEGAAINLSWNVPENIKNGGGLCTKHKSFTITMLCMLFFYFLLMVFLSGCTMHYITSFVIKYLGWNNRQGALIVSVFSGAFGLGRLINVAVSIVLSPRTVLITNLIATFGCYMLMCFLSSSSDTLLWLSIGLAGLFQSSTYPTSILWASGYIHVTGTAAGVFLLGASSSALIYPKIVSHFFESGSAINMIYMFVGLATLQIVLFIFMQLFAHFKICKMKISDIENNITRQSKGKLANTKSM